MLDIRRVSRQIGSMTKKPKSRRPAQDESQIALSVVEKVIGGKLVVKTGQTTKRRSSIATNPRKKEKA